MRLDIEKAITGVKQAGSGYNIARTWKPEELAHFVVLVVNLCQADEPILAEAVRELRDWATHHIARETPPGTPQHGYVEAATHVMGFLGTAGPAPSDADVFAGLRARIDALETAAKSHDEIDYLRKRKLERLEGEHAARGKKIENQAAHITSIEAKLATMSNESGLRGELKGAQARALEAEQQLAQVREEYQARTDRSEVVYAVLAGGHAERYAKPHRLWSPLLDAAFAVVDVGNKLDKSLAEERACHEATRANLAMEERHCASWRKRIAELEEALGVAKTQPPAPSPKTVLETLVSHAEAALRDWINEASK